MKRSKLEAYYVETFGAREAEGDDEPDRSASPRRRDVRPARRRRSGFGVLRLFKLALMLGPMSILLGATLLMDCQSVSRGSWVPEILRSTACARRDFAGRVLNLDGNLRTVVNSIL